MKPQETKPLVTVLMPVYNAEKYLKEAIDSILLQSFTDFEFIIINDGSTDNSKNIILSYNDKRIKYFENENNIKLIATLNRGLELANGKYIARMDADDISLPERLEKQVVFMDKNQDIGLCGTWIQMMGTNELVDYPEDNEMIKIHLMRYSSIGHATVMMRKDYFIKNSLYYDGNYIHAEDYELWSRCIQYFPMANIPEILYYVRIHMGRITVVYRDIQVKNGNVVRLNQLNNLGIDPTPEEAEIHKTIFNFETRVNRNNIKLAVIWLQTLREANSKRNFYLEPLFTKWLASLWKDLLLVSPAYDINLLKLFIKSDFRSDAEIDKFLLIKFCIKCLIGYKRNIKQ